MSLLHKIHACKKRTKLCNSPCAIPSDDPESQSFANRTLIIEDRKDNVDWQLNSVHRACEMLAKETWEKSKRQKSRERGRL